MLIADIQSMLTDDRRKDLQRKQEIAILCLDLKFNKKGELIMAGGAGTGLFLHGICNICDFDGGEEIEFDKVPTDQDIQEAKRRTREIHKESGCNAHTIFWIEKTTSSKISLLHSNYPLPDSAKVLLVKN